MAWKVLEDRLKIVSPYRCITPYMPFHVELDSGWWVEALRMLRVSGQKRAGVETFALTCDTNLPVPHYCYPTEEPLLMLWILEVSLAYMESEQFDQDTVFITPDALVIKSLDGLFSPKFDIAITRKPSPKFIAHPLMNGLQFWPIASREKLIAFQRTALAMARTLDDEEKRWGADTTPLVRLLGPIEEGLYERSGMRVRIFPSLQVLRTIGSTELRQLEQGLIPEPRSVVMDFKTDRKQYMRPYFERVFT